MYRRDRTARLVGLSLAALLLCAACGSDSPGAASSSSQPTSSTSPSAGSSVIASAVVESSAPGPTTYTAKYYGYTVTLPVGWSAYDAQGLWDGVSDPGHDELVVDRFLGPDVALAWGFAAPTTSDLSAYAAARAVSDASFHQCPAEPATVSITIDGEPGLLQTKNCGILVMSAVTIHNGTAFSLYMQDSSVQAASDPVDEAIFRNMIASLQLPA